VKLKEVHMWKSVKLWMVGAYRYILVKWSAEVQYNILALLDF